MNEIKWNDRFNIGVESIDNAHRRLFSIVSKLISLNEDPAKQQHACREGIKYFKNYTLKHFADEEAYMQSIGYSNYAIHKRLHDTLRDVTLPALEAEMEEHNYSVESVQHFLGICVGWLNGHVMIEDHAITGHTMNKWMYNPAEDELPYLEKAIIQALFDLFGVKAHIITKYYSGEDFASGKSLCYRLTFRSAEQKTMQAYLIYEEKMILNMLGEMLGHQLPRIDKTVAEAMALLSQRFINCISVHFALTENHKLVKTDLLTFAQVSKLFITDKQYPPYSLLFNTDKNEYFAFCVKK
ncbi:MAG: hemerythrin domain-containing protein [Roseburia sp.]|nr:hemerythrin domain-containing protein [Roseburia sp.]MCM1098121.1 hemerythrin domain-containing protein [Ruminococcus flavefaciens]